MFNIGLGSTLLTVSTFQVVLMLLLATNYIPVVVNHLLMAFYSAKVPFHCKVTYIRHYGTFQLQKRQYKSQAITRCLMFKIMYVMYNEYKNLKKQSFATKRYYCPCYLQQVLFAMYAMYCFVISVHTNWSTGINEL